MATNTDMEGNITEIPWGSQAKLLALSKEAKPLREKHIQDKTGGLNSLATTDNELQRQQAQMSAIVTNKIRSAFNKVASLIDCRDKLGTQLDQKNQAIEEVKGSVRRGEDLKQYVELLRKKSTTYKASKKEMDEMAAEYGVLLRTQQLLEQQAVGLSDYADCDYLTFSGFNVGETLNPITLMRGFNDGEKSSKKVRKQISELDASLDKHRDRLAPEIKELKALWTILQEKELEHMERKHHCDDVLLLYERKGAKLERDAADSCKEYEADNKCLQETCATIDRLEISLDQLSKEKESGGVSLKLRFKIEQLEELVASLQRKQQKLKDKEHSTKTQMEMMGDLLNILAAKLTIYSSGSSPAIYSTNSSLETVKL